jgi:hypothetical protein
VDGEYAAAESAELLGGVQLASEQFQVELRFRVILQLRKPKRDRVEQIERGDLAGPTT